MLAWAWAIATLMANVVWSMPQFSLGLGAMQQNIFPFLGTSQASTIGITLMCFVIGLLINYAYETGSKGVKVFENILKAMVGLIVIAFFLVVGVLTFSGTIKWSDIFNGMVPRVTEIYNPAKEFIAPIAATG